MTRQQKRKATAKQQMAEPVASFVNRHALMPLRALDHTCPSCDFDEAEGGLINHCDACCRKIVTELWAYREGVRLRIQREKKASKK